MSRWFALTLVLNSLSRSMGYADFYPFQLGSAVQAKLAFVHKVIAARRDQPAKVSVVTEAMPTVSQQSEVFVTF
jgi:hypothetical protein